MKNVFLYLYPIEEFIKVFNYDSQENSLLVLEECIKKRYRDKGYQVVFALYPDKHIFGVKPQTNDKIIYTDISFIEATTVKNDKTYNYPNEKFLLNQLGAVDNLIIGGFHAQDCVKKVAEAAMNLGIYVLVDLDLTDFFFHLYKDKNYFKVEEYSPQRYKNYLLGKMNRYGDDFAERIFNRNYQSSVYGFDDVVYKKIK